jgi:hypothetical protein
MNGKRPGDVTMPFGAIQEIVRMLDADPKTDWSKVNLEALRQHLIDMDEVTLKADAATKQIDGGIEVTVTGMGRTVEAIQRMVPAHANEVDRRISMAGAPRPTRCRMACSSRSPRAIRRRWRTFAALALSESWRAARRRRPESSVRRRGETPSLRRELNAPRRSVTPSIRQCDKAC